MSERTEKMKQKQWVQIAAVFFWTDDRTDDMFQSSIFGS